MGFFDKILGRAEVETQSIAPTGDVQSVVVTPRRPHVNQAALQSVGLRNGMWVVTAAGSIGILTACGINAIAEVTLTKPDGKTLMTLDADDKAVSQIVLATLESLRQAYIEEIPEQRRQSVDVMRSMGYTNRSEA